MPVTLGNILGGLGGAALGFVTGGPAGAIVGGLGGSGLLRSGQGAGGTMQGPMYPQYQNPYPQYQDPYPQYQSPGFATGPGFGTGPASGGMGNIMPPLPALGGGGFVGGGGGFGGGGAGAMMPPPMPLGPTTPGYQQQPTYSQGQMVANDMFGPTAIQPQGRTVVARRPGYVTVVLPFAAAGFGAGQKVQLKRDIARKLGLWKPKPKPLLTAGDAKTLRKAERLEKKLVGLTRKHTDFKCVSKVAAARQSARKSTSRRR